MNLERDFSTLYFEIFGYSFYDFRELEVVVVRAVARERVAAGMRETFSDSEQIVGLLKADYCTLLIAEGWTVRKGTRGSYLLEKTAKKKIQNSRGVIAEELIRARFESVAEGMGELLRRTSLSTNVKERLDFSCALLDGQGRLIVNAPHVPVHLGALGVCVRRVSEGRVWKKGDMVVVNHPRYGGSHLPDVTVVSPIFGSTSGEVVAFVANRAHHAEIGGMSPGSMPGNANSLQQEGVVIPPVLLFENGRDYFDDVEILLRESRYPSRSPKENLADLRAQAAANFAGLRAMSELIREQGEEAIVSGMNSLFVRARNLMNQKLSQNHQWTAQDSLDDGTPVCVRLTSEGTQLHVDFTGSGARHPGNLNATEGVTRSAVLYVLRLWLDEDIPLNEGLLDAVRITAKGTFLEPEFPDKPESCPAIVGGNVETSQRIVEVMLAALGLSAESQGTMNNLLFGNKTFGYYETIGGGSGATHGANGASGVHVHMTNTSITDPEILEYRFPVRLWEFSLRCGSGGQGCWRGGEGLIREIEFLQEMTVTLLSQRRTLNPRGFKGGSDGAPGKQYILTGDDRVPLPSIITQFINAGEKVRIETPGGGGYGLLGGDSSSTKES